MSEPYSLISVLDDRVIINKLMPRFLEGNISHLGNLSVTGKIDVSNSISIAKNLTVGGEIVADTITVKNLITETPLVAELSPNWNFSNEAELENIGLNWNWDSGKVKFVYKRNQRLWTNASIDLDPTCSYKINNIDVISITQLGAQVTKSNLKQLGTLTSLQVSGDANIGNFAYFNSTFNRIGINTDTPNGSLSIRENNVEIVAGSPQPNIGTIGTYTNHDFSLLTDNTSRIVIKNNGDIVFGKPTAPTNVVINGTLTVDNLVSDNRIERSTPLEFFGPSIYNTGLVWKNPDAGSAKKLILKSDPDRIWCSETFDISEGKSYQINNIDVLCSDSLGDGVKYSNLAKVGVLESLSVKDGSISVYNDTDTINISSSTIDSTKRLSINIAHEEAIYVDSTEITIGNKNNTRRPLKLFGPVAIGINNPDSNMDLSVQGNVCFNGKRFVSGTTAPTSGNFSKGDICWNENPSEGTYVGWVCTIAGSPGNWMPFGSIGR